MSTRRQSLIVSGFLLFSVLIGGMAIAESTSSVEAENSIETPERTVDLAGQEFTVDSVGYVDQGNVVRADVSGTGEDQYSVYIYNGDGDPMVQPADGTDDGSVTIPNSDNIPRGTYLLVLSVDGSYESVQPLVISGYEFDVAVSTDNGSLSTTVELTGDTPLPAYVDVAVLNETARRYKLENTSNRTYTVEITDLEPGDYRLYAAARSTEQVNGRDEVVGISSPQTVSIDTGTESTTTTSSDSPGGTEGGGGSVPPTTTSTSPTTTISTSTNQSTSVSTTTTQETVTTQKTPSSIPTPRNVGTSTQSISEPPTDSSSTTASVISPNTSDVSATATTTSVPGFSIVTTVLAGFVLLGLLGKQS